MSKHRYFARAQQSGAFWLSCDGAATKNFMLSVRETIPAVNILPHDLEVFIVSYGSADPAFLKLDKEFATDKLRKTRKLGSSKIPAVIMYTNNIE